MYPLSFETEKKFQKKGFLLVAGIDEVGRGCIAGPVVAACVVLGANCFSFQDQIKDSKALSQKKREHLAPLIKKYALGYGIGFIDQKRVDEINILQATFEAMAMALKRCPIKPDLCLVDGNQKFPYDVPQETIVQGDQKIISIASASIIAKVFRDQWMARQGKNYPVYDFAKNKGYGTLAHRQAIAKNGFCDLHRRSFQVRLD